MLALVTTGALVATVGAGAAFGTTSDPEATDASEKVIIDADMGQLNDDALAMFALLNDENTEVLGVTTVAGNTWVEEGTAYSLKQLEIVGHTEVPVIQGAGGPLMGDRQAQLEAEQMLWGNSEYIGAWSRERPSSYLELANAPYQGYPETEPLDVNAVDFIVDSVKANPGEVTLFVLGPATNIALAVKTYPEIVPLVKQVIYMGGAIDIPGNTTPAAEFNWWFDPEAIKITLNTPFERQLVVPNDIAERVYYTKDIYDRVIEGERTPVRQMFIDQHGPRFEADPDRQSYVWDLLTAAVFIDPSIATDVQERYIDIDVNYGPNYGRSIGYHESRNRDFDDPSNFPPHTQKVEILFDIDREAFADFYVEYVGGLGS
ncbi:nucleoside hydrolase [Georgenia wangjunii]|uniref:nucleoside hydrolase n=1 Tax=Georgenia wangjunii TaxID=3117730 RepID=UPI002F266FA7